MTVLFLKRASASRPSGEWNDDDYDVLADGVAVGQIMEAAARGTPDATLHQVIFTFRARSSSKLIARTRSISSWRSSSVRP